MDYLVQVGNLTRPDGGRYRLGDRVNDAEMVARGINVAALVAGGAISPAPEPVHVEDDDDD